MNFARGSDESKLLSLHRLQTPPIQIQQLVHVLFGFCGAGAAESRRRRSRLAHACRPRDKFHQVQRNVLVAPGSKPSAR